MLKTAAPEKTITNQPKRNLMVAFATPIGTFQFSGVEKTNQQLKRLILEKEKAAKGNGRGNAGWHSSPDLLKWASPAVDSLRQWIAKAAADMLSVTAKAAGPARTDTRLRITAWANVCRRGNYQKIHNFAGVGWSGLYFVDAGVEPKDAPGSGLIEICDPRQGSGERVMIRPSDSAMFLFPCWLERFVNPYLGNRDRITIGFHVVPYQDSAQRAPQVAAAKPDAKGPKAKPR